MLPIIAGIFVGCIVHRVTESKISEKKESKNDQSTNDGHRNRSSDSSSGNLPHQQCETSVGLCTPESGIVDLPLPEKTHGEIDHETPVENPTPTVDPTVEPIENPENPTPVKENTEDA